MFLPREVDGIRYAVMRAGSQTKLADLLGVSKMTVSKWVRQGFVPNKRVKQISELYDIPPARLCNPTFLEWFTKDEANS